MSLIEEAAKRLEQLRNAGVEVDGGAQEPASAALGEAPVRETARSRVRAPSPAPASASRSRLVNVDLARLRAAGFVTPDEPTTQIATEFRVIKRPLLDNVEGRSAAPVENANLIMITSAVPGEGKTFTSVNLAMSMALELDRTVLLVDADATRSSVMAQLGVTESRGLTDLLLDPSLELSEVLLRTNVEKLSLLPAGSPYARATELIASDGMMRLVEELATRYPERIVIFDAPPLLPTTESRVLARHMGQIVMVVEAEKTTHAALMDAMETIKACPVVSMVLNKRRQSEMGAYYGGYYYRASRSAQG
jgi:receptor protein-tyrosine kinase